MREPRTYQPIDPPCPDCGHLATYHNVWRNQCVGHRDRAGVVVQGGPQCHCTRLPSTIPGWDEFRGQWQT